jgi:hypothetical protein
VQINDAGDIAFAANLSAEGPIPSGIFLASQGTLRSIAFTGQPLPGTSDLYEGLYGSSVNNRSDFVLVSQSRVFLLSDGSVSIVARSGQLVPNSNLVIQGMAWPSINDAKDIVFVTRKEFRQPKGPPYFVPDGIVRVRAGVADKIVAEGDPVPGIEGAVFERDFGTSVKSYINNFGGVVFSGRMRMNAASASRVIMTAEDGKLSLVAREGEFIRGIGTMYSIGLPTFSQQAGPVTFVANMNYRSFAGIFTTDLGRFTLIFPQIADGSGSGDGWRTTVILANRSTVPASATVQFYDDGGAAMNVSSGSLSDLIDLCTAVGAKRITQPHG